MFKYNFIYELKQLIRSRWIQVLSLLLLILFGFAVFNGQQKTEKRLQDITKINTEIKTADEAMLKLLDSIEQGLQVSVPRWRLPNNPMALGNNYPRVAHMPPNSWAFIATGQSDLYTHYVKPEVAGDDFALGFTEMTSPIQLLFGNFDLAFVLVYLLPLIIIAFSFNILSHESESGSLKLLASQPISLKSWVLQKIGLRFFWLSLIIVVSLSIVFMVYATNPLENLSSFLNLMVIILAYMAFWFALGFLINIKSMSSAKNALALIGCWIFFVLIIPTVINQLGTSLHPMPSRTVMVNEMRKIKAETTKRQDEILDNFLRDHPEYAINDTSQSRSFWHKYIASQRLIKEELAPITEQYTLQLRKQQTWLDQFKWISPAMTLQESLNKMAGTSTEDYDNFRTQVLAFSETWRSHFMPFLYNNRSFTVADYSKLPTFKYQTKSYSTWLSASIILLIALGIASISFLATKRLKH